MTTNPTLIRWRQKYGSAWEIEFGVEGSDDTYVMHAPGNLSETFAVELGAQKFARILKVPRKTVFVMSAKNF